MKYYGTSLSQAACTGNREATDNRVRWMAESMNICRLHYGDIFPFGRKWDDPLYQTHWDNFCYTLATLKDYGIQWCIPLSIKAGHSQQDKLDWLHELFSWHNPYTGQSIGSDESLAIVGVSNEDATLSEAEEAAHFSTMYTAVRQYTDAMIIGSQVGYEWQTNTLDGSDLHWYVKDRALLDDPALWPVSGLWGCDPAKPYGVTECNSSGIHSASNLITMIYAAALNDCDWFIHHNLAMHHYQQTVDHGGWNDEVRPDKLELLKLGSRIFHETQPIHHIGNVSENYQDEVERTGSRSTMNHMKPNVPYRDVLPGVDGSLTIELSDCTITVDKTVKVERAYE